MLGVSIATSLCPADRGWELFSSFFPAAFSPVLPALSTVAVPVVGSVCSVWAWDLFPYPAAFFVPVAVVAAAVAFFRSMHAVNFHGQRLSVGFKAQ